MDNIIKEIVGPSDGLFPIGIVTIEDTTGKIIYKGKNLVVEEGRKYIYNMFKYVNQSIYGTTINAETRKIRYIKFGTSTNEVKFTDTSLYGEVKKLEIDLNSKSSVISERIIDNHNSVIFSASVKLNEEIDGGAVAVSELGLFLDDDDKSVDRPSTMFSRIVIDPIPIGVETEFVIKYALYF